MDEKKYHLFMPLNFIHSEQEFVWALKERLELML